DEELCHNFLSVVATTNDEGSELLVCGTNSFSPICTTYTVSYMSSGLVMVRGEDFSGKQRCPYGPNQPSAAIFTGGSLYAGTYQAFTGVSPVVSRSMGDNTPLKTASIDEAMNRKCPRFVKMIEDDKRVLVFFNEMQKLSSGEVRMVAQVGQVCKNDVGGDRVLSRMWTTFIKSRLNCSYNGFYLNELRDVTEAKFVNGVETIFATFSTPEDSLAGAAVCSFTMNAIREALHGAFLVGSDPSAQTVGTSPAASRHPASCPSEKMTDSELFFIKSHPQMKEQVPATGKKKRLYH
uniref:Sema domain-containing protein n=1 Tax=Ciona intestinalis TaxID=7719 RepID=F6ZX31_CIOIN